MIQKGKKCHTIVLQLPWEMVALLETIQRRDYLSRSEAIRQAIRLAYQKQEGETPCHTGTNKEPTICQQP